MTTNSKYVIQLLLVQHYAQEKNENSALSLFHNLKSNIKHFDAHF